MDAAGEQDGTEDPARRLAAEILARLADGEVVDLKVMVARLPDEASRRRCLQYVEDGQTARNVLPRALRPGVVLRDRFRLVRELGAGGMGRVFEAEDLDLKRRVAVKILTALGHERFDPEQQFLKEAHMLASLQHPNIVAAHELGRHGDHAFFVMDLVDGTPLADVLDAVRASRTERGGGPRGSALLLAAIGRPIPAGRRAPPADDDWFRAAARVALDLAHTIEAAHKCGIVHRDIKPQNVLLRGDASPVVLDFGLAGTFDRGPGTVTQGLFGTVAYLAPEQVKRGRIGADPRSDVYQLGLLLYEMLTLRRAFPGDEISDLLEHIGRGEFLRPRAIDRSVPADLEAVCLKAMELDPARRYPGPRELREDLQRWVEEDVPPRAARGGRVAAGMRNGRYFLRRHRLGTAATLMVAALCVAWLLLLPEPTWTGDLQIVRQRGEDGLITPYPDVTTVRPGDNLCVVVRGDEPAYIYAVSVFGRNSPREWVVPLPLKVDDDVKRPMGDNWGVLAEPGCRAICAAIDPGTPPGQREGLLLFASLQPQKWLADWMDELNRLGDDTPGRAVPYEDARKAFETAQATRGVPVSPTPQELEALRNAQLMVDSVLDLKDWRHRDPRRWLQIFTVEGSKP